MGPCPYRHGVAALTASAVRVVSESRFCVCRGSLMRVVYQVCSSSVEEWSTNLGKQFVIVRWYHPHGSSRSRHAARDRDLMPKTVCVLLACLVLAAGQAAKRDTTQWRCRNRKLSCKRWAADNQCTANYPFMAEGALHHHLRAHGTRHTAHAAARGARHVGAMRSRAVDAPLAHPWTATCTPTAHDRGVMHVPTR